MASGVIDVNLNDRAAAARAARDYARHLLGDIRINAADSLSISIGVRLDP